MLKRAHESVILEFFIEEIVQNTDGILKCTVEMCLKDECPKNQKEKCKSGADRIEKLQQNGAALVSQVLSV